MNGSIQIIQLWEEYHRRRPCASHCPLQGGTLLICPVTDSAHSSLTPMFVGLFHCKVPFFPFEINKYVGGGDLQLRKYSIPHYTFYSFNYISIDSHGLLFYFITSPVCN